MSIADFKGALKDKAYMEWFKNSSKSIFIQTTTELRKSEESTQKTSLLITDDDIKNIGFKLAGRGITTEEFSTIKKDLMSSVKRRDIVIRKDGSLFYPVIPFDSGIGNVLLKGFKSLPKVEIIDPKSQKPREARVSDFFQRGHVFSIASNIAEQTKRNLMASKAPDQVKSVFIPILEDYIKRLKEDDIASSNIGDSSYDLYAKYEKNPYKYIVELQPIEVNQASGRASHPLTNALRRYFDPKNDVAIEKFFRERVKEDNFIQTLIKSKGSPSFSDLIVARLGGILSGKPGPDKKYTAKSKLDRVSKKVDASKVRKSIKSQIQDATLAIDKLKKIATTTDKINRDKLTDSGLNLTSLQALLDKHLQDVISANMGDGKERRILNYRTGRFAASAKVERLSVSREGMVTAFYTYMKNPYQTFEPGFRQGSPKTRDPKLLIANSIREIAATTMITKMRSVLV